MNVKRLRLCIIVTAVFSASTVTARAQSNIDAAHKSAFAENIGWTNWRDADGAVEGVIVGGTFLSGYIWGENVGWIDVGAGPLNGTAYTNTDSSDFGVNIASDGALTGYAWSENGGWLNYDTSTLGADRVRFDAAEGRFRGWVWSENFGWVNLADGTHLVATALEPPAPAGPPHDILKNRYISIDPTAGGANPTALYVKVTLTDTLVEPPPAPHPEIGSVWWAGQPNADGLSEVTSVKPSVAPDWTGIPLAHLTGCPIMPTSTYDVTVVTEAGLESPALGVETQARPGVKWCGDAVGLFNGIAYSGPNGVTNIDDAVAAIKTWQQDLTAATHVSVTDIEPMTPPLSPNMQVNFNDVFWFVECFKGKRYPGGDISLCP